MRRFSSRSLGLKLGLACAAVELVLLTVVLLTIMNLSERNLEQQLSRRVSEIEHLLSMALVDSLARKDYAETMDLVDRVRASDEDLIWIEVNDLNDRPIVRRSRPYSHDVRLGQAEIRLGGQSYGKVHFALSIAALDQMRMEMLEAILLISVVVIGASILLFVILGYWLTARLRILTSWADTIAAGNMDSPLSMGGYDEVGRLSSAFSAMMQALKKRISELAQAREVAEAANQAKSIFLEDMLRFQNIAHYDSLTHLPNRILLADRLEQAMAQTQRRGQSLAVVYLDLDGFKAVNDQYGHAVGDELLIAVTHRMKEALRDSDTLARIGGDEFIALLADLENLGDYEPIVERLLQAAAQPIRVGDTCLRVSASIGVTLYPQDDGDADRLIHHADLAMYIAKQAGKNRYHRFDSLTSSPP